MTVGSVKHSNVLPQPASASSARVPTDSYGYNGTGSSGSGGSGANTRAGSVGNSGHRSSGGGRISAHSSSKKSSSFASSMMRSKTKCCLFGIRPDPMETMRICEENDKAERQRSINSYGFDPYTCRSASSLPSSTSSVTNSSVSSGGLHNCRH